MPANRKKSASTPQDVPGETEEREYGGDSFYTGRHLVLLNEASPASAARALSDSAGIKVAESGGGDSLEALDDGGSLLFENIGVAVVNADPDQMSSLSAAAADDGNSNILALEPERVCYALSDRAMRRMLEAFVAGAKAAGDYVSHSAIEEADQELEDLLTDSGEFTWGLQATQVPGSRFSGAGIRLCVLDTGMDTGHPDFSGRPLVTRSFVPGETVQDGNGHGTHCIGTAGGPRLPARLPRYGIAYGALIHAGKVLSNGGSGGDAGILAGINWAVGLQCPVISMSLGGRPGTTYSAVYEGAAVRALNAGSLIIAAAGNDSARPGTVRPVAHPANCPSIMAVGAVDSHFQVASFSNGGLNPNGGKVDIAGPGVDVRSAWPRPRLHHTISGTSMATPHVAGIAALLAESNPGLRGRALWQAVLAHARALNVPVRDVGSGLVQAPQ